MRSTIEPRPLCPGCAGNRGPVTPAGALALDALLSRSVWRYAADPPHRPRGIDTAELRARLDGAPDALSGDAVAIAHAAEPEILTLMDEILSNGPRN